MALVIGNVSTTTGLNDPSPISWAHTVAAGSDILIVLTAVPDSAGTGVTAVSSSVDGALTELAQASNVEGMDPHAAIWYLLAPTEGAHTIEVTWNGAGDDTAHTAIDYAGADQSTPWGTPNTGTGQEGTEVSRIVTTAAGEVVIDNIAHESRREATAGADQTQRSNHTPLDGSSTIIEQATSTQDGADGGTMSWGLDGVTQYAYVLAPLKPAGAGGGGITLPLFHAIQD